jgi:hypothetical protein
MTSVLLSVLGGAVVLALTIWAVWAVGPISAM